MDFDFTGKNVIVTGGAGGIGRNIVKGVAEGGGKAIIVDINENDALNVIKDLGEENVFFCRIDLSNPDEIRESYNDLIEKYGHIDSLINNAGMLSRCKFEDLSQKEWDKVFAINLTAIFAGVGALAPHMISRGKGSIVNVASIAGKVGGGYLGTCAYASSKAAVIGLTKAIAREFGPFGIRCNTVCPGYTNTSMTDVMTPEQKEKVLASFALHRRAEPHEVANVILFLASDLASFITADCVDADGGMTMD